MRIVKLFLTCARFPIDNLLSPVNMLISTTQSDFHLRSFTLSPLQLINTEQSGCVPGPPWGSRIQPICLSGVNVEAMSLLGNLCMNREFINDREMTRHNRAIKGTDEHLERGKFYTSETHELIC